MPASDSMFPVLIVKVSSKRRLWAIAKAPRRKKLTNKDLQIRCFILIENLINKLYYDSFLINTIKKVINN